MSSHSSWYPSGDFAGNASSKLPKKSFLEKKIGQNTKTIFPSEDQDDSSSDSRSESDSDHVTDGDESEQDQQNNYGEMTMEELIKLQEELGTKKFKEKVLGANECQSSRTGDAGTPWKERKKQLKRANKNRPSEVPMMRRVARRSLSLDPRQKIKKKVTRDPRFDNLSGELSMKIWKGNYSFLKDKRKEEKEILKKELKLEQDRFKKQKIKSIIQRMENQEREHEKEDREMEIRKMDKQQQMESLKQGKKPRFMTKKERKLLLKAAHFEQLKKDNRVDKYLERKEKRKLAKERRNQGDL